MVHHAVSRTERETLRNTFILLNIPINDRLALRREQCIRFAKVFIAFPGLTRLSTFTQQILNHTHRERERLSLCTQNAERIVMCKQTNAPRERVVGGDASG
jgi:hypothetical protein